MENRTDRDVLDEILTRLQWADPPEFVGERPDRQGPLVPGQRCVVELQLTNNASMIFTVEIYCNDDWSFSYFFRDPFGSSSRWHRATLLAKTSEL